MFGIFIDEENIVDVKTDEGKELVEKYGITTVPTFFVSDAVADYPDLQQAWLFRRTPSVARSIDVQPMKCRWSAGASLPPGVWIEPGTVRMQR